MRNINLVKVLALRGSMNEAVALAAERKRRIETSRARIEEIIKKTVPIHYFHPHTYKVPCGAGDKIFSEGHGGSIYPNEVTCENCLAALG